MASPNNRTAADVAQMESDLEYLRGEVERLTRDLAVVTADRTRLQVENAMLAGRANENLVKATRMETIVRQISSGLVDALKTIDREREVQREVRRQVQEEHLAGSEPPPQFLQRQHPEPTPVRNLPRETARAAEEVMPPRAPRPARIDHSLADRDTRLPPAPAYSQTDDERELARIAGDIQSTRRGS